MAGHAANRMTLLGAGLGAVLLLASGAGLAQGVPAPPVAGAPSTNPAGRSSTGFSTPNVPPPAGSGAPGAGATTPGGGSTGTLGSTNPSGPAGAAGSVGGGASGGTGGSASGSGGGGAAGGGSR